MSKFLLLIYSTLLLSVSAWAQELELPAGTPFTTVFDANSYGASPQVWDLAQDSKGRLYFGNGTGLTRYDGNNWQTFPVANNTTVRAVVITPDDRIYVGAKGEFGFFEEDSLGMLEYNSLSATLPEEYKGFRDVWQMAYHDGKVYFAPFEWIVSWDGEKLRVQTSPIKAGFRGITKTPEALYVKHDSGFLEVKADTLTPVVGEDELSKLTFTNLYPYNADSILVSTSKKGLFWYKPNNKPHITPFPTAIDSFLKSTYIYKGLRLSNGNYAFVSLSKGVMIMNPQGEQVDLLNKAHGLSDDAAYSIYEDASQNLWIGTNNGLSYVEVSSPIRHFQQGYGINGQVLSFREFQNKLYVGTTTGLFYWDEKLKEFEAVRFFNANFCWDLLVHQEALFVATNTGLYRLSDKETGIIGTEERFFKLIADKSHPDYIFAASRDGIVVFHQENDQWKEEEGRLGGLQDIIRSVQFDKYQRSLWAGSNFNGIYKFELNWDDLQKSSYTHLDTTHGLPSLSNNYIYLLDEEIRIGSEQGLLKPKDSSLVLDLDFPLPEPYQNASVIPFKQLENGDVWFGLSGETEEVSGVIKMHKTANGYELQQQGMKRLPVSVVGDFFFVDEACLIGGLEGIFSYNNYAEFSEGITSQTLVNSVSTRDNELALLGSPTLPYKQNAITFTYSAPLFEMKDKVRYQYKLDGNEERWSDWTDEVKANYTNLYEGRYAFRVKAKDAYGRETQEARYEFSVLPPWYRSIFAYIAYIVSFVLVVWSIVKWNSRRLRREKESLELEVQERTKQVTEQNTALLQQREEISTILESLMDSNDLIEKKNKDITDSITYASRIQRAILPYKERLDSGLGNYFVLWKPRDIVSGDYYWFYETEKHKVLVVADCTGHGVPGAFMSMVGSALLDQIVIMKKTTAPAEILAEIHLGVQKALQQEQTVNNDGMDMAVCVINEGEKELTFAGAKNGLVYIQNNKLMELKGNRRSVGGKTMGQKPFAQQTISIDVPTAIYLSSDGYQDQFGGPDGRKLMKKKFKEQLFKTHQLPMPKQQEALEKHLHDWMTKHSNLPQKQIDDILVVGMQL